MHQRIEGSRNVTLDVEEGFFDVERGIAAFKFAGFVVVDAMTEDEVLRSGGRANGIRLHESHFLQRALESSRCEEIPRDGKATQIVERDRFSHSSVTRRCRLRPVVLINTLECRV